MGDVVSTVLVPELIANMLSSQEHACSSQSQYFSELLSVFSVLFRFLPSDTVFSGLFIISFSKDGC